MRQGNGAILFDRDGIVNERIIDGYVRRVEEFHFLKPFLNAFKTVKDKGYKTYLITNQQGVGKGLMTEDDLHTIHDHMQASLYNNIGIEFDGIYYCTDLANTGSKRRKPQPGMLLEAIKENNLNIDLCWFIGDSLSDVEAGNRANMNTILVNKSWGYRGKESPTIHIPDLELLEGILRFLPALK